jgi:hypothetical protein
MVAIVDGSRWAPSASAVSLEKVGERIEMSEGRSSYIVTWVVPILSLVVSIVGVFGTFLTVPAARLVSLRHRLRIMSHGILVAGVCCLFAAIPFVPQSAPRSAKKLCDLRDPSQGGYPSLAVRHSRSSEGDFLEVQGQGFGHDQVLDVAVGPAGHGGWPGYGSAVAQSNGDGYFEATVLLSEYASGSLCVFASPKLAHLKGAAGIDASYDPRFTGSGELTID